MANTYTSLHYHVIFNTKNRQPFLAETVRDRVFAYLGGIVRELGATALIINGTSNHVHMLIRTRPTHSVAAIARVVKANSSKMAS